MSKSEVSLAQHFSFLPSFSRPEECPLELIDPNDPALRSFTEVLTHGTSRRCRAVGSGAVIEGEIPIPVHTPPSFDAHFIHLSVRKLVGQYTVVLFAKLILLIVLYSRHPFDTGVQGSQRRMF
ncbi:hypothetical protein DL93DRAFT_926284 [Clavulina sp. PMI_390]|nr:hypothetical protein DL93DRAFT_926284 [Clavulina sp. PMI_390]